jgi:hypothetical protein
MLWRRSFVLLLALAMLAFPASSFAGAGDDQYQDPLAGGNSGSGGSSGSGGNSGSSGSSGSTPSTGSGSAPATASPSTTDPSTGTNVPTATAAQTSSGELPRTGFDVILTFELGVAMLLSGLVAQRMLVLRERRRDR